MIGNWHDELYYIRLEIDRPSSNPFSTQSLKVWFWTKQDRQIPGGFVSNNTANVIAFYLNFLTRNKLYVSGEEAQEWMAESTETPLIITREQLPFTGSLIWQDNLAKPDGQRKNRVVVEGLETALRKSSRAYFFQIIGRLRSVASLLARSPDEVNGVFFQDQCLNGADAFRGVRQAAEEWMDELRKVGGR